MTIRTTRASVLAKQRWREQAARLIVEAGTTCIRIADGHWLATASLRVNASSSCTGTTKPRAVERAIARATERLADGETFDVAVVRAYCEAILADAERRAQERIVFTDWTREQGLGPENRDRGAFCPNPACKGGVLTATVGAAPGDLIARAIQNSAQTGSTFSLTTDDRGEVALACQNCAELDGGWPGPIARQWAEVGLGPRNAAAGPGPARTAKRLLDALDGRCAWNPEAKAQPSECRTCAGWVTKADGGICPDCRGYGHNLAGTLPPIVDDIATVAAVADAWETRATAPRYALASWQQDVCMRNRREIFALRNSAEIAQVNSRAERRRHYRRLLRSWRGLEPVE